MVILAIIVLVIIIVALILYNVSISKKIQTFNNINQKITSLNILQDFMDIMGEEISSDTKVKKINETLIEKYKIKYSTIVVFNGAEYIVKASNVDTKHWENMRTLHEEEVFKDSIMSAQSKYITVENEQDKLPYLKEELNRVKSAIFFPLYIDNVYIGYWIIEGDKVHEFDKIDTTILDVVKENIIITIKNVRFQNVVENTVRIDKFTNLKSAEYLYGEGLKQIERHTISTICMYKILNIEKINETSRELGNKVITKISELIDQNLSKEYIFVRFMGPKFVIAFAGVENAAALKFMQSLKIKIEDMEISINDEIESEEELEEDYEGKEKATLSIVMSTYYKGTGLEEVTRKLEQYLDNLNKNEIKVI